MMDRITLQQKLTGVDWFRMLYCTSEIYDKNFLIVFSNPPVLQ